MKKYLYYFLGFLILVTVTGCSRRSNYSDKRVRVVTSTNIYANIAKEVLGRYASVRAVINNGDTDPHDFEPTVDSAKEVAQANIVIANGLGYDDWMGRLAQANDLHLTKVGEQLLHKKAGDNPHIWYDLKMPEKYASYLVKRASELDPRHQRYYKEREKRYLLKFNQIKKIANKINGRVAKPVFVSEPVFDYVLEETHFKIADPEFEKDIENEVDPSAQSINKMQRAIRHRKISFFVNNTQASSSTVKNFLKLCHEYQVPVLNVRETMPNGVTYYSWMKKNYQNLSKIFVK